MVGVYGIYFTLATEIDTLALRARGRLYIGSRGEINPVDTSIHRLTYIYHTAILQCPMTSLTLLFPRTLSSAHSGDILQILLEPCFHFYFLALLFSCVSFCFVVLYLFIRLAFTIAFASWSLACMLLS